MPQTVKSVRIHEYGGPEVLSFDDVEVGEPGPGEVRVRHNSIGINFADMHTRAGRSPLPHLPHCIGAEAAGTVEALGDGVDYLAVGDRVAYSSGGHALPRGAYCEARGMVADRLILLPDEIDDDTAAAMTTKGLTAHYLVFDVYPVGPDDTIAVHAAAGGVGQIICQWANALGARVEKVKDITDGKGVPVVYDAVGADTFEESLHCLRPRGLLASYGTASGPIPPFDIFRLNQMGSLYITSAAFLWQLRNREEMLARARDLIDVVTRGDVKISIANRYPLANAAQAHRDMELRTTTGMSVLIP